jgi:hypothetical protein
MLVLKVFGTIFISKVYLESLLGFFVIFFVLIDCQRRYRYGTEMKSFRRMVTEHVQTQDRVDGYDI